MTYIKYANPDLYPNITKENFKFTLVDLNGLYYLGNSIMKGGNHQEFLDGKISIPIYFQNELNISRELYYNFEIPQIICKN